MNLLLAIVPVGIEYPLHTIISYARSHIPLNEANKETIVYLQMELSDISCYKINIFVTCYCT